MSRRSAVILFPFLLCAIPAMSQDRAPDPWTKPPRQLHLFAEFYERLDLAEEIVSVQESERPYAPEVPSPSRADARDAPPLASHSGAVEHG